MARASRSTLLRYTLFQLPEALLVGLVLYLLWSFAGLSDGLAWLFGAGWVLKEIVLYPFVRRAYEPSGDDEIRELVGSRGVALAALDPVGTVRVSGEIWRAVRMEGSPPIKEGDEVRVRRRDGYVLHCEVPGGHRV